MAKARRHAAPSEPKLREGVAPVTAETPATEENRSTAETLALVQGR
jgi:hypothetical protein